jgi:alginate O-acetyltransferase complex protein AlgI
MLFCSPAFAAFFGIIFVTYWAMPWHRARVWLLLAASFYFYASWNRMLALLIVASTTIDYFLARWLEALESPRSRRLLLLVSLVQNLGVLVYFKYANFFLESLREALARAGVAASLPVLEVILPVGISFYTFEAINYVVDVYRRRAPAERSLPNFMLFILFFPHLVAGPIVRARDFLPQIRRPKRWDWARLQLGLQMFVMGLFKKVAIADRMVAFVDPVFAAPEKYGSGAVWIAVLAYAVQIYCDFSGYTDMALGAAHALGYKLARNFNAPYLSANVSEFWRRWHISLSSWLRDYLFVPLGGSRSDGGPWRRRWRTARNLMVTMALGGLWHGAAWTFVTWGVLHGLMLIGHRAFRAFCESRPRLAGLLRTLPGTLLRVAATFLSVCLAWVFFRAPTFGTAAEVLRRLAPGHLGLSAPSSHQGFWYLAGLLAAANLMVALGIWKRLAPRLPGALQGLATAAVATLTLVLAPLDAGKAFIYFQF